MGHPTNYLFTHHIYSLDVCTNDKTPNRHGISNPITDYPAHHYWSYVEPAHQIEFNPEGMAGVEVQFGRMEDIN